MSDTADAFMQIFGFHRVTTKEDAPMIFTQEQTERLPGSTVRLRDHPGRTVIVGDIEEVFGSFTSFHVSAGFRPWDKALCFANTGGQTNAGEDIVEVIRWADEPDKPEATSQLSTSWNPHRANYEIINGQICVCKHRHEKSEGCRYDPLSAEELAALLDHYRTSLSKIAYSQNSETLDDVRAFAMKRLSSFKFSPNATDKGR